MKAKLFFLVFLAFLGISCISCSERSGTYQIRNNRTPDDPQDIEEMDGTLYNVTVFCYIDGFIARQDDLGPVGAGGGISRKVEVPASVERVRIAFTQVPSESDYFQKAEGFLKFVDETFYLDPGKNTVIEITDSTLIVGKLIDYYYSD